MTRTPDNRPRKTRLGLVIGAVVILCVAVLLFRKGENLPNPAGEESESAGIQAPDLAALRQDRSFNILLITLDTTRADRIGAYGFPGVETPAIDSLAERGVLFRRAYSPVPLTLPAHVSLFTGEYPFDHGVRDNGGFAVPTELTTAAELYRQQGYATAAFVASYVLAARWGLDQGFDTYVDGLNAAGSRATVMNEAQRPANEVVDDALAWMEAGTEDPFFLWVHLYDPHTPYAPPEPFRTRYADDPYAGEIAFMDEQIGRLLSRLQANGDEDRTFIIVAGDHGESLGEHDELEHGFFIYEEAIHVPLIVSLPFEEFHGTESGRVVSLIDVMPTMLAMNGVSVPAGVQGRSLTGLFAGDPPADDRVVYSETYYPRLQYGWSELTSVQDERYKLIVSPQPELYDLVEDPGETINLVSDRLDEYELLRAASDSMLAAADPVATQAIEADEATRRALESLGYLAGGAASHGDDGDRAAPRERIEVFNKSLQARTLMGRGELDEAARLYNEILDADPMVSIAYERLGDIYMLQQRFAEAAEVFRQAIPLRPDWHQWYTKLAEAQLGLDEVAAAEQTLLGSLDLAPPVPYTYCLLGYISELQTDYRQAVGHYESCLLLDPTSAEPLSRLASAYLQLGDLVSAEDSVQRALQLDPTIRGAHFAQAQVYARRNQPDRALLEYLAEIESNPDHAGAHFALAMQYGEAGNSGEEERHLEHVLEIEPEHPVAALFLANIFLTRGENYERAVGLVTAAVEKPLAREDLAAGYFILSNLHQRLGNLSLARQYMERAESLRAP